MNELIDRVSSSLQYYLNNVMTNQSLIFEVGRDFSSSDFQEFSRVNIEEFGIFEYQWINSPTMYRLLFNHQFKYSVLSSIGLNHM